MEPIEILKQIKINLLEFIEDLMIILPEEKDFYLFHIFVENQVPMVDVMTYIINNIIPLKHRVIERDEDYFKKNAILFENLGAYESNINRFKMLWDASTDAENREMVWKYLERFIQLGINYTKLLSQHKNQK